MQILFSWLITKKGKKPRTEPVDIINIKKIISPINTDDRKMNISFNGDIQNVYIIDKAKAEIITKNANEELVIVAKDEEIRESQSNAKNVLLKFNQVEDNENNNKKTKGIITEINDKSYPILFAEGIKHNIIHGSENPLIKNYLVNVKIHLDNKEIKAYTVLEIIDSYNDENEKTTDVDLFS